MDRLKLAEKIREIANNAAQNESVELVHVEVIGSSKKRTVRVFIDRKEGVTHDHCSAVSQEVGRRLEAEDFISNAYVLEVSSPGIERGLYSLEDYKNFKGSRVKLKTHTPLDDQRNFHGQVVDVKENRVIFDDKTNGIVEIPFEKIRKAKLEVDFDQELKKANSRRS